MKAAVLLCMVLLAGCAGKTEISGGMEAPVPSGAGEVDLMGKKIVMIVAPEKFRDEELFVPKDYFESKGIEVSIASTKKGECTGMLGGSVTSTIALSEVDVGEFDAVVFVGGAGTPAIRREARALEIAREAVAQGKVLAGICWASTTLAKAGVLDGKNATVWIGNDAEFGMQTNEVLEKFGANYVAEGCVVDGKIVTADGPASAKKMAQEIVGLLG